jgi:hypothetical protein
VIPGDGFFTDGSTDVPDQPTYAKRIHPSRLSLGSQKSTRATRRWYGPAYAELRCKSNFSFLRGASHPEELAERAAKLGYTALAVTDRNTLAGVVRMHCAAKACSLKLIIGAELTPVDAPPVLLYATDRASYGGLCRIITQGRLRETKGSCAVTLDDIVQWSDGLIAAVPDSGLEVCDGYRRAAGFSPRGCTLRSAGQVGSRPMRRTRLLYLGSSRRGSNAGSTFSQTSNPLRSI